MHSAVAAELKEVLAHYDLGELLDFERNERGFVNTAYAIHTLRGGERKRYFLRKYKPEAAEPDLLFEHSLIEHLVTTKAPVAPIQHSREGGTYVQRFENAQDPRGSFYTIFDFLPGEERYTWIDPRLTEGELRASAAVLAEFHIAACDFTPRGHRLEPKILDLLPVIAETWRSSPGRSKGTLVDARIQEQLEAVHLHTLATLAELREPAALALPKMIIHCDYHPGNLKFQGEAVSGLFDFDWSKLDTRLFDLGLALWYFCTSWQGDDDGVFSMDRANTFLKAYRQTLDAHPCPAALSAEEMRCLPAMISAGNAYVLHWTIMDYFAKDVDPAEYLMFVDHSLSFMRWYQQPQNLRLLQALSASSVAAG